MNIGQSVLQKDKFIQMYNQVLLGAKHGDQERVCVCIGVLRHMQRISYTMYMRPNKKVCVFPVTCPKKLG